MPSVALLALVTMAAAFQRMMRRSLRSNSMSPGNGCSKSGGIVLMYGVETVAGTPTARSCACLSSLGNQVPSSRRAVRINHGVQGLEPFDRFVGMGVRQLVGEIVADHVAQSPRVGDAEVTPCERTS